MPARNIKHFVAKLTIYFSKKIAWSKTTTIYSSRLRGSSLWSCRGWRTRRGSWRSPGTPRQASPGDTHHPRILRVSMKHPHLQILETYVLTLVQVESSRKGGRVVVAVVEVVVAAVVQGRSLRHPVPWWRRRVVRHCLVIVLTLQWPDHKRPVTECD